MFDFFSESVSRLVLYVTSYCWISLPSQATLGNEHKVGEFNILYEKIHVLNANLR